MPAPKGGGKGKPKEAPSVGLLGDFYQALFINATEQAKKYGAAGAPDLIETQVSDAMASGIANAGAMFGAMTTVPTSAYENTIKWFSGLFGNISIANIPMGKLSTYSFPQLGSDDVVETVSFNPKGVDINVGNINSALVNPKGFAEKAADTFWEAKKAERNAKIIAQVVNAFTLQPQATTMFTTLVASGVDADIANQVANARRDAPRWILDPRENKQKTEFFNQNVATFSGAASAKDRAWLKKEMQGDLGNSMVGQFKAEFARLSDDDKKKALAGLGVSKLGDIKGPEQLFGRNPKAGSASMGMVDALLSRSVGTVTSAKIADPHVSAQQKKIYRGMQTNFSNAPLLNSFVSGVTTAQVTGYRDRVDMVRSSLDGLTNTTGGFKGWRIDRVKDSMNWDLGKMSIGDRLAYINESWRTATPANKWVGAAKLITGDGLFDMASSYSQFGLLGPLGVLFTGRVPPSKIMGWTKKSEFFQKGLGVKTNLWEFHVPFTQKGFTIPGLSALETGYGGKSVPKEKKLLRQFGYANTNFISNKANWQQKLWYMAYTYHPWQFATGLLNGQTLQRIMWINSKWGSDPSKINFLGKAARFVYNNPLYRTLIVRPYQLTQFAIRLPFYIIEDLKEGIKQIPVKIVKWVGNKLFGKLAKKLADWAVYQAIKAAFDAVLAGITGGLSIVYNVLNILSLGILDQLVGTVIKFLFEIIVTVCLGLLSLFLFGGSILLGGGGGSSALAGTAGKYAPDPSYAPVTTSFQPRHTGPGPDYPINTVISLPGAKGVDVSHWDGNINWATVKATGVVEFAIIKATEGTGYSDDQFTKNWSGTKSVGIKRTAYHFFRPELDGTDQADYFLTVVKNAGADEDFQLAVDVETPCSMQGSTCVPYSFDKDLSTTNLKAFLDRITAKTGKTPIIYTNAAAWSSLTTNPSWGSDVYPLWDAHWTKANGPSNLPSGWSQWLIWQYTNKGHIDGIPAGSVDLDLWHD